MGKAGSKGLLELPIRRLSFPALPVLSLDLFHYIDSILAIVILDGEIINRRSEKYPFTNLFGVVLDINQQLGDGFYPFMASHLP